MEVPGSGQHCFQQLSEFQKQLDAAVAAHQQRLKNTSHIDISVNGKHLERLKLDWIFEKVEDSDPLFTDLTLLRLYIIAKLFNLSNSMNKLDGESMSHIQQFVKHIVDVRMQSVIGWLDSTDEHIGYAAINTLIDICFSPAASHITANLYMDLVRLTTTSQGSSARTLALFIKELKLALKSIKVETDDGEINKNNVQYLEAMKILFLFGNSAEVRVTLLKRNNEDNVRANIELYILMLKLLTYLNDEHVSAQYALNFKLNVARDCLPVLGQQITAAYSHLTIKKYLRLCSQLISVLSLTDLNHTMNTLYPLIGRIFNESTDSNDPSIFGHQTVLATRRLFILLVLDITKNLLANLTSADHVALELSRIGSAAVSLLRELSPKQLLAAFFELFQEQDDDLMTGLWYWLSVSAQWSETTTQAALGSKLPRELIESITRIVSTFHPHAMFHEFLAIVDYDHNVLLDFLVSNETDFLLYFLQYLKHVTADWTGFTKTMAQFDSNEAVQYLEEAKNSGMSEESKRELEEMLLSMSKLKINTMQVDSNEVKRVMDVIRKLGVAIKRLVAKDLFPYNIAPLLKWIANAEQFYNQK